MKCPVVGCEYEHTPDTFESKPHEAHDILIHIIESHKLVESK